MKINQNQDSRINSQNRKIDLSGDVRLHFVKVIFVTCMCMCKPFCLCVCVYRYICKCMWLWNDLYVMSPKVSIKLREVFSSAFWGKTNHDWRIFIIRVLAHYWHDTPLTPQKLFVAMLNNFHIIFTPPVFAKHRSCRYAQVLYVTGWHTIELSSFALINSVSAHTIQPAATCDCWICWLAFALYTVALLW